MPSTDPLTGSCAPTSPRTHPVMTETPLDRRETPEEKDVHLSVQGTGYKPVDTGTVTICEPPDTRRAGSGPAPPPAPPDTPRPRRAPVTGDRVTADVDGDRTTVDLPPLVSPVSLRDTPTPPVVDTEEYTLPQILRNRVAQGTFLPLSTRATTPPWISVSLSPGSLDARRS